MQCGHYHSMYAVVGLLCPLVCAEHEMHAMDTFPFLRA